MSESRKVLVIIDPTQESHIALERAVITSEVQPEAHVHLFIGVDAERSDLRAGNAALYRDGAWLEALQAQLNEAGVEHSIELCWSNEWQAAVLQSARRFGPDHIFMPDYIDAKKGFFFSNQQWSLVRNSVAPVTIVRPGNGGTRKKILAAVNMQREDDPHYARLIQKILTEGMNIARHYEADFHVINAYADSMDFPNRERILKLTNLPSSKVHVREGDPADVIAGFANEIGADTVIIGTLARQGAAALMRGNTSEKVLRKVKQDVIAYA